MHLSTEDAKNIGIILSALILGLWRPLSEWLKTQLNSKLQLFNKSIAIKVKVNEILTEMLNRFQAQRTVVYQYHNGDKDQGGVPFMYVSITYEQSDVNTQKIAQNLQKLPIALFAETINDIVKACSEGKKYLVQHSEQQPEDVEQQMLAYGVTSAYHFLMTDRTQDGVVTISFARHTELDEEELAWAAFKVKEIYRLKKILKDH